MREDRLDEEIKRLLQDISEDYDESSWDKLSQRLDSEDLGSDETDFTDHVKRKIDNHTIETSEEHWELFSKELDQLEKRKNRVYIIKMLEVAILLLLVMTYLNYTQFRSKVELDVNYISKVQDASDNIITAQASLAFPLSSAENDIVVASIIKKRTFSPLSSLPVLDLMTGMRASHDQEIFDLIEEHISLQAAALQDELHSSPILADEEINKLPISYDLPTPDIAYYLPEVSSEDSEVFEDFTKGWSVSVPLSYDVDFMNTNLDLGYLSQQIQSGLAGKSIGALISYRKGFIEAYSGLVYSRKSFVPGRLTNYTKLDNINSLREQLDHMVLHQVQIPLYAKIYAMPADQKVSIFALAGFSGNGIIHNEYHINQSIESNESVQKTPNVDLVNLQRLPSGLLQGGDWRRNVYLSGMFGLGVETRINPELDIYIQPMYRHALTGNLTRLVNQVHTLSIEAGITYKL